MSAGQLSRVVGICEVADPAVGSEIGFRPRAATGRLRAWPRFSLSGSMPISRLAAREPEPPGRPPDLLRRASC